MSVKPLPREIVKLISSTQVISSVSSVVKELVENSIDAGATVVDIKLEKYGLDKIEVRDNGIGISTVNIHSVCKPNHTSKIHTLEDLEVLKSYGFRGEALNSICAVSRVSITTRTEEDRIASTYKFDNNGTIRETEQSHQMKGTTITIINLFKNVPVRRQYYDNVRKASEELKKIEKVAKILSVIHPQLRVTISHNKCLIWHKTAVSTLKQSLMQMYQHVVLKNLEYFSHSVDNFSLEMLICKRDCNWSALLQPLNEAILFYINQRPVRDKKVEKVVLEEMSYLFQSALPSNKCPLTLISLKLPSHELDVNLEPDKTKIFIRNHSDVLKQLRECVTLHFYKQPLKEAEPEIERIDFQTEENPPKRPKVENAHVLELEEHHVHPVYDSSAKNAAYDDSQTNLLSAKGHESLDSTLSIANEFEYCDTTALENLCERTEGIIRAESAHSEASSSIPTNADFEHVTMSNDSGRRSLSMTENTHPQYPSDFSEPIVMPNSMVRLSNTNSSPVESSTNDASILERETVYEGTTSNRDPARTCNSVKIINEIEPEITLNSKNRLSISGNLVDHLFQSQVADNEEILLQNTQVSRVSVSKSANSSHESDHDRYDCISTERISTSASPREEISSPRNVSRACRGLSDSMSPQSKDGGCSIANSTSLTQTTLSQWSRGYAVVNDQPLKGPSVLPAMGNLHSEKLIKNEPEKASILERSVSSQMGRKDMAGLTNFAKSARLELMENDPGMSFTRVASELAKRWRSLDESQRNEYAEKAKTKKIHRVTSTVDVPKSMCLSKKQKLTCKTSIDAIKTGFSKLKHSKINPVRVVKTLEPGNITLCRIGPEIVVVDVRSLQRNVIHHRYVRYSCISSRCLEEPVELTEKLVGSEHWNLLLSLDKSNNHDGTSSISDPRILKNGFEIALEETLGEIEMWLTGAPEELETDIMRELTETLRLAAVHTDVEFCRPGRIQQILREKSKEISCDSLIESDEIETLLEYWVQNALQEKCASSDDPVSMKLFTI